MNPHILRILEGISSPEEIQDSARACFFGSVSSLRIDLFKLELKLEWVPFREELLDVVFLFLLVKSQEQEH